MDISVIKNKKNNIDVRLVFDYTSIKGSISYILTLFPQPQLLLSALSSAYVLR